MILGPYWVALIFADFQIGPNSPSWGAPDLLGLYVSSVLFGSSSAPLEETRHPKWRMSHELGLAPWFGECSNVFLGR